MENIVDAYGLVLHAAIGIHPTGTTLLKTVNHVAFYRIIYKGVGDVVKVTAEDDGLVRFAFFVGNGDSLSRAEHHTHHVITHNGINQTVVVHLSTLSHQLSSLVECAVDTRSLQVNIENAELAAFNVDIDPHGAVIRLFKEDGLIGGDGVTTEDNHIVATYLRNDPKWKDKIVYWGPMGCLTGFYLIVKGRPAPSELLPLLLAAFDHCAAYGGEVPGATPEGCGNYLLHDLNMAKYEAERYADLLRVSPCFEYPKAERVTVDGRTFFDS